MAHTEHTMFEYIQSTHNGDDVTFPMCVNCFDKFEKGSQAREVLVTLACKILVAVYSKDPNGMGMSEDDVQKLIIATYKYK
jgi:hypothetical protein